MLRTRYFENLLSVDGTLGLIRSFYQGRYANSLLQQLSAEIDWLEEQLVVYGRRVTVPRLMSWHGDPGMHYRYARIDHPPSPWTETLLRIREDLQNCCHSSFNSVMANLYRNGRDSMGRHADNEAELGAEPVIASISLGASRLLRFRHNHNGQTLDIELGHGDMLLMSGTLQQHWQHELPKTGRSKSARINLTYRKIFPELAGRKARHSQSAQ